MHTCYDLGFPLLLLSAGFSVAVCACAVGFLLEVAGLVIIFYYSHIILHFGCPSWRQCFTGCNRSICKSYSDILLTALFQHISVISDSEKLLFNAMGMGLHRE